MRRSTAVLVFASALVSASMSLVVLAPGASRAAGKAEATFIVPGADGYGVGDCLAKGSECGQIVATAWCEAQGYAQATAFGPSARDDVTGSIATARPRPSDHTIAITCAK